MTLIIIWVASLCGAERDGVVVKMEKQFKQKSIIRQCQPLGPSKPWKPNWKTSTRGVHHNRIRRARSNTLERRHLDHC